MTEQQIPKFLAALVEHQTHFTPLPKDDAQWVILNTAEAVALCVQAIKNRSVKNASKLSKLRHKLTIIIPATTERFVAKDNFVLYTEDSDPVKISYLGDKFKEWFLFGKGKIEEPIAETTLSCDELLKSSVDGPIIAEIGGEAKAETTLAEVYALMRQQPSGGDGVLLNNGYANIFYVNDQAGVLRTIRVFLHDYGWNVSAYSLEDVREWIDGRQVFYRNSL